MAVGNKYRLKIKRGAGAPSFTLDAGQLYLDTTNKTLYVGDGTTNHVAANAYKRYEAVVAQTGAGAPSATVLANTLGGTVVWARSAQGVYTATLAAAFTANKTTVYITSKTQTGGRLVDYAEATGVITLTFRDNAGAAIDENNFSVEIRVRN